MKRYWVYLLYVLRHKWFVFQECRKRDLHVPLLIALWHDWDKFLSDEFIPYARFFHNPDGTPKQRREKSGYYKPTDTGDNAFDYAWFLHQKRNKHHWQYWVIPQDHAGVKVLPMPDLYIREMIADWRGAGRAQGVKKPAPWAVRDWYLANGYKLQMHDETRTKVEDYIGVKPTDRDLIRWEIENGRPIPNEELAPASEVRL